MNYNCSTFWHLRNLQEQVKKAFCYQKLFWPFTVWINCSSDLKFFENSRPSASNFKSFSRSLEQFFVTVGQNNFGNKIPLFFNISRTRVSLADSISDQEPIMVKRVQTLLQNRVEMTKYRKEGLFQISHSLASWQIHQFLIEFTLNCYGLLWWVDCPGLPEVRWTLWRKKIVMEFIHQRQKCEGSSQNSFRPISYFWNIWELYVLDLKIKNQLHFPMDKGLTVPKQC